MADNMPCIIKYKDVYRYCYFPIAANVDDVVAFVYDEEKNFGSIETDLFSRMPLQLIF